MKHSKQRTDIIHGTIYLSKFESELTSTPYFYRLHDIYQSSTVYLTFPSNRTKRYEHSLGTMALASNMLFSSLTNAETQVRNSFLRQLNEEFIELSKKIFTRDYPNSYLGDHKGDISKLVQASKYQREVEGRKAELNKRMDHDIEDVISCGLISDDALNHFSLHSAGDRDVSNRSTNTYLMTSVRERFIYQCILQAVRIVALFHDVGHPPYSHIIETVLTELYDDYRKAKFAFQLDTDKAEKFEETLGRFLRSTYSDSKEPLKFQFLNTNKAAISPHLHEQVGIHMLYMTFETVMPELLESIQNADWSDAQKMIVVLYYINAIEFAAAILLEKDDLFKSIHRIVDGVIDADRLDYVVRDSHSSGVDWGTIPYKRLIDSAKLVQEKQKGNIKNPSRLFFIAYPQKVSSDIEDFLLNRYKIFARINYHHRCTKTAAALKSAVKILAQDYLCTLSAKLSPITDVSLKDIEDKYLSVISSSNEDTVSKALIPNCISSDIHILWTALGQTNGDEALKVLQWNDSWMVSVLQSALLRIRTEENFKEKFILQAVRRFWNDKCKTDNWINSPVEEKKSALHLVEKRKEEELEELCKNLEEFLLNKKAYYSVFKRGIDVQRFVDSILREANILLSDIEQNLNEEKFKYLKAAKEDPTLPSLWDCLNNPKQNDKVNAIDSIRRLQNFLEAARIGDLQAITSIFPPEGENAEIIIQKVLDEAVKSGEIFDYKLHINEGWEKDGLPSCDDSTQEIYLYEGDSFYPYDISLTLRPQIQNIKHSMLWLYVYIMPTKKVSCVEDLLTKLRDKCALEIGTRIKKRYVELFPHHS